MEGDRRGKWVRVSAIPMVGQHHNGHRQHHRSWPSLGQHFTGANTSNSHQFPMGWALFLSTFSGGGN